jgi:hypothetical protein
VPRYLEAAGHYEFGPQRRPIHLDPARVGEIAAAWRAGDDWRGYARQWAQVYGHVHRLREDPALAGRIFVVRFEDACADPQALARDLLAFCGLADAQGRVQATAATLAAPAAQPLEERAAQAVWEDLEPAAALYGYLRKAREAGCAGLAA